MADVVVLGSVNMDLVARVKRLPLPGETLTGTHFASVPGGKGANQAVAAARLGASTAFVGRVGRDELGRTLRSGLSKERVDVRSLFVSQQAPSGTALIAVAPYDNQIIVIPGANGEIDEEDLARLTPYFDQASVLLLQFEIPLPIVEKAAALAYQAGLTVIVDPAPVQEPLGADFCEYISILTPNQSEAALLTGQTVNDVEGAIAAAKTLHNQGIAVVIVKLGALGSVCVSAQGSFAVPAFPVQAIDTVAAGDAFNGGLAAALSQHLGQHLGQPTFRADPLNEAAANDVLSDRTVLKSAIDYASAVAALAVTQSGAQTAMPTRSQVDAFLQTQAVI
ncbi:MAG: ribokinase [Phormidesmis sp.]